MSSEPVCKRCDDYGIIGFRKGRPIPCPDCPAGCGKPEPKER